jgi:hypothetical protein
VNSTVFVARVQKLGRRQLRELGRLRWGMVRERRQRLGLVGLGTVLPVLCTIAFVAGRVLVPDDRRFDLSLLLPSAYLGFLVVAVLAAVFAGGGNELFPPDQLVAYPITARTTYLGTLLLAPVNVAWVLQLIGLVALTSLSAPSATGALVATASSLLYVLAATAAAQTVGWALVAVRGHRLGRWATNVAGAALALAVAAVVLSGRTTSVLDRSPTLAVARFALAGADGQWAFWSRGLLELTITVGVALVLGVRATRWALRRPALVRTDTVEQARRRARPTSSPFLLLLRTDIASVTRSAPLRRGLLVLSVMPGAVAALARLEWSGIMLLPGLVAAGAGLLFGVNAFCLDGSGAVWLETLPGRERLALVSKAVVIAGTCAAAVLIAALAAAARAPRPTPVDVAALACCAAVVVLRVTATCLTLSVRRPHRADLRQPRDTPAPPGTMAAYSARLAASTTLLAVLFSAASQAPTWRWPVLLAVPFLLLSARRLVQVTGRWAEASTRARIAITVSAG